MSTHLALHDTDCVPHVHGRWHAWVTMHLLMSVAALAPIVLVGLLYLLLFFVAMAHWEEEDHSWSSNSHSARQDGDWTHSDSWGSEAWGVHPGSQPQEPQWPTYQAPPPPPPYPGQGDGFGPPGALPNERLSGYSAGFRTGYNCTYHEGWMQGYREGEDDTKWRQENPHSPKTKKNARWARWE